MLSPYQNFVITDTETGGLPNKNAKATTQVALTEIALVAVNSNLEITEKESWLIKPYADDLIYDPRAAEVSGITKELCEQEGLPIEDVYKAVVAFLKKQKVQGKLPVLIGHNIIKFDAEFMINFFEWNKDDLGKYVNSELEDTLKWARLYKPEANNYKLGTACEDAGITLVDGHRAMSDAKVTAELWIHYMKNLRGQGTQLTEVDGKVNVEKSFRDNFEL